MYICICTILHIMTQVYVYSIYIYSTPWSLKCWYAWHTKLTKWRYNRNVGQELHGFTLIVTGSHLGSNWYPEIQCTRRLLYHHCSRSNVVYFNIFQGVSLIKLWVGSFNCLEKYEEKTRGIILNIIDRMEINDVITSLQHICWPFLAPMGSWVIP